MEDQEVNTKLKNPGGVFLYLTLVAFLLILSGCPTMTTTIQEVHQRFVKSIRQPGERMVASPDDTTKKYSCLPYRGTKFLLEEIEVIPSRVSPGEEINHRIRYAFCPNKPSGIALGRIARTVLFKGEQVFMDVINYEFKPGTWTVDAFISIPKNAPKGVYAVELTITHDNQSIRNSNSFHVTKS